MTVQLNYFPLIALFSISIAGPVCAGNEKDQIFFKNGDGQTVTIQKSKYPKVWKFLNWAAKRSGMTANAYAKYLAKPDCGTAYSRFKLSPDNTALQQQTRLNAGLSCNSDTQISIVDIRMALHDSQYK